MRRLRRSDAAILYCSVHVTAVGSTSPFAYSGIQESAGIGIQHFLIFHYWLNNSQITNNEGTRKWYDVFIETLTLFGSKSNIIREKI